MATFDYDEMSALAKELCDEFGRAVTLYKLGNTDADAGKPWRGEGVQTPESPVATVGVFVVPNTSIPTESRGLAFDWVDQELLTRVRHVLLVPALGLPVLDDYKLVNDGGQDWKILWGQCLQPGPTRLLYVFGVAR